MRRIGLFASIAGSLLLASRAHAEEPLEEAATEEVPVEDEGPKPDEHHGVVAGKLTDAETREEIIDGQCSVLGQKAKTITDAEGYRAIDIAAATRQPESKRWRVEVQLSRAGGE